MRRPLVIAVAFALTATLASPASADHTDESVVDITFPVAGPYDDIAYRDDFHDSRGNRLHLATDIMGPKHRTLHAAVDGTVGFTPYLADDPDGPEPHYGWLLSINGDDGRMYRYLHINNDTPGTNDEAGGPEHAFAPKIADAILEKGSTLSASDGIRVKRGEHVAYLGDSGNASTPHLHFEIFEEHSQNSPRINPYASLKDAEARGDYPEPWTTGSAGTTDDGGGDDLPFTDLTADGAHTGAITRLAEDGIVTGCGDGRYCPHEAVSRGDLAAFLAAALGLEAEQGPRFDDVDDGDANAAAIAAVDEAGILTGFGDDRFGPDSALERAQLATMLVQGFAIGAADGGAPFADVDADGTHTANIAATFEAGLTVGCSDDAYCPWDDVTRGQIATFIDKGLATLD